MSVTSPIAIVTGAGAGIGREIAMALARNHWTVAVNDINETSTGHVAKAISHENGRAICVAGDIGQEAVVRQIFDQLENELRSNPALLINNAAIQTWASIDTLSMDEWQKTIATNLTGNFLMTRSFAAIAPAGSAIINIGSGCNQLAFPKLVDYAASKGGVEMLTKSAALELGPKGIRVNCIAPGAIATERTALETGDYASSWASLTPLQRIGTPEDVANAVLLLTDPKASFITGQTINVDGGLFSRAIWPEAY